MLFLFLAFECGCKGHQDSPLCWLNSLSVSPLHTSCFPSKCTFSVLQVKGRLRGRRTPKYLLVFPGFLLIAMDQVRYLSCGKEALYRLWELALQAWLKGAPFFP